MRRCLETDKYNFYSSDIDRGLLQESFDKVDSYIKNG